MPDASISSATQGRCSVSGRIEALRRGIDVRLFEHIAMHPQSGIYERFESLWPKVVAVLEGEVYDRNALFDAFVLNDSYGMDADGARNELWKVTTSLADAMTWHGKVVTAWRAASSAPSVSKRTMDIYRIKSGFKKGNELSANGQPSFRYSTENTDAFATICDEDCDTFDDFVTDWILQPFLNALDMVSKPFRSDQSRLPEAEASSGHRGSIFHAISIDAIAAWGRSLMVMVAVICAAAAIFVLNRVKKRELRIVVMGLFAVVYALPIQFLSPRSLPMYTLILSFFQSMVMFVGTADDDVE